MRNFNVCLDTQNLLGIAAALSVLALSACGGGDASTSDASPGGIWTGTDSQSGLPVTGLVDEAGNFNFIRSDGVQYVGTADTAGDSLSASFGGYAPFGSTYADGSTHGTGTLTGTLQQRASISANTEFRTDNGTATSGTLSLTFSSLYDVSSSLMTISGNYMDIDSGDVISVTSGGGVSWQDGASGCVGSGTISIINANYNAYQVQFSYSDCMGQASVLNGVQFSGLATFDNTVNPARAIVGVTGEAAGVNYAVVLYLNHD